MEYKVIIGRQWETNDMGIANNGSSEKEVPLDAIVPGYDLFSEYGGMCPKATVVSFEDDTLVFEIMGKTVSLEAGHSWNSPMYRQDNPYIYEAEGYFVDFRFKLDVAEEEKAAKRVLAIVKKMRKNADEEGHPVWKNIPLAREMYDLLHNKLPIYGKEIDAAGVRFCCDIIFIQDLLDQRDVPRLCLEFLLLRKRANKAIDQNCWKFEQDSILSYQDVDTIQNHLDFYIDPGVTMEWWVNYTHRHLLFDPVERTKEWEDIIYEVEKAVDRRLKGVPRGMGFCYEYWSVKRAELAKRGIEWKSPSQMNPKVRFD